jgi:N-terminal domain of NWD NACHT-NTPase
MILQYEKLLHDKASRVKGHDRPAHSQPRKYSKVIELGMEEIKTKMWMIKWTRKPIVIREQIDRILKIVKNFSGVMSGIATFEPHTAMAWAGVSAVLPVSSGCQLHGSFTDF